MFGEVLTLNQFLGACVSILGGRGTAFHSALSWVQQTRSTDCMMLSSIVAGPTYVLLSSLGGGISYGKARSHIEQEAEERKKLVPAKV